MKKIITGGLCALLVLSLSGCTEVDQVNENLSKEANNFNVQREITVFNTRTDTVLFQMQGTFALTNDESGELVVTCEVGEGKYKKHFIYLGPDTTYVVEDISGAGVDKYHYEINFLPEWGVKVTHNE